MSNDSDCNDTRDLFLSAEERYDVWEVKRQERPYLLVKDDDDSDDNNGCDDDHQEDELDYDDSDDAAMLPLIDGCDISNWRRQQIVKTSSYIQGALNVGAGCPMLRRESQLPILMLSSRALQTWKQLEQKFQKPPTPTKEKDVVRIPADEAQALKAYPWFERDNVPVILEGLTANWKAMKTCRWENLVKNYGDYPWRFSDTHGACMALKTYDKYCRNNEGRTDDAPLAVYDSQLDLDNRRQLLHDYQVPSCFNGPDLFGMVMKDHIIDDDYDDDDSESSGSDGEDDDEDNSGDQHARPPYRWILMGPERSGTGLHIDPLGTHAWVTLVEGKKRWVLFPPDTPLADIGMEEPQQIPSAIWFYKWYDRALQAVPSAREILQLPGETVYVPAGWPHLVLNVERSVAITHNYATEYPNFDQFQEAVAREEPDFYEEWKEKLQSVRPDLFSNGSKEESSTTAPAVLLARSR